MTFTKTERRTLEDVLAHLTRAQRFLSAPDIAIAKKCTHATTTLHYSRNDGASLYELSKEVGSDLTGLQAGISALRDFLNPAVDCAATVVPNPGAFAKTYEEVCVEATTAQGLDGIVAHLRATGYTVEVDQTGGFTMVARIENECNDGWYGITNDGTEGGGDAFLLYFYEDREDAEGRSLAEDLRTRQSWSLELYADVSDRLLAEYVPPVISGVIKNRADVKAFFNGLLAAGVNFHPDTPASGYTTPLLPLYDAAVARCFEVGDDQGFDVYEVAVESLGGA